MSIFSKFLKSQLADVFDGMTDWHCHILPGVDDGFRNMESSLKALSIYEEVGVTRVFLTPHVMEDMPNTTAGLKDAFAKLKEAYTGPISLNLASENMLDRLFDRRLADKDFLPLPGKRLLVETSYFNPPIGFHDTLNKIRSAGFFPVLAHPERYNYMDEYEYEELHSEGVIFQLNLASLMGHYGPESRARAEHLLSKGFYSLSGTDLHRISTLEHMLDARVSRKIIDEIIDQVDNG